MPNLAPTATRGKASISPELSIRTGNGPSPDKSDYGGSDRFASIDAVIGQVAEAEMRRSRGKTSSPVVAPGPATGSQPAGGSGSKKIWK
jgi:hypothetical protein